MLKTVTLDTFRDTIAAEQKHFLGIPTLPTFFGILSLTIVVIDTYLNAIGKPGFTVFSINSIFSSIHYLALFSFVIILQLIFISIAFLNLRHLRFIPWKSPIIHTNYLLNNRRVHMAFFITLAILISWGLSHAISVSSNLETVTGVSSGLLAIIFTSVVSTAIVIIVDSFIKILRLYPSLSVGLIFGIFICTVSHILTHQPQVIVDFQKVRDNIISEQTATTITGLKVRENPGSQSSKLGEISTGDLVTLLGKEAQTPDGGTWVLIGNNNIKGWVNKKFLSINPPSTNVSKITDNSSERVYLSEINQFRYWQAGIFFATITSFTLFFLLIQFNQATEETIFQLDLDKDESGTSFYEYSPIGLALNAPIYINFLAQNQLIVAFSRDISSGSYKLLDVKDNQSTTPLHNCSVTIWNISKVTERINKNYELSDTLNFFQLKCFIGFIPTDASYTKKVGDYFDYSHINFITDIIFKNNDSFSIIIEYAIRSLLEEFLKPHSAEINNIITQAKKKISPMDTNAIYTSTSSIDYKLNSLKTKAEVARENNERINNYIQSFGDMREKMGEFSTGLPSKITEKIAEKIGEKISEIGLTDNFIYETKKVLLMIGFRIKDANINMLDNALQSEIKLNELFQKLSVEVNEADKKYGEALEEKERIEREEQEREKTRMTDIIGVILNSQISQGAKVELINNISGEQKIPKIAQTTSLQLGNDDIDNPT